MRLPQFHEVLQIEQDGTFEMWRSVSMASMPPSPIGRFAGGVGDAQQRELGEVGKRAAAEGSLTWLITPDSPVDTFQVNGASAKLGIHDKGEGAWRAFAELVRPLLGDLTSSPLAAIALRVDDEAILVHLGTDPLPLDLSTVAVRADHRRDGQSEGRWMAPEIHKGQVDAGPGWQLELPFEHGFELQAGDRLTVHVTFAAHDGDRFVQVSLQTP